MQNTDYLDKKIEEHKEKVDKVRRLNQELYMYALDLAYTIFDTSMSWDSGLEKKLPGLKRARTMSAKIIEINQDLVKLEAEND